jgi:hypothetical protein
MLAIAWSSAHQDSVFHLFYKDCIQCKCVPTEQGGGGGDEEEEESCDAYNNL